MGEITALTAAGAFELADGARLVCHRSLALLTACPQAGGMIAVGVNARRAAALVSLLDLPGLSLAVRNAPAQSVLSGTEDALRQVQSVAGSLQLSATVLSSPFPFHSPLVAAAGPLFAEAIRGIAQRPLARPVYSPVAGRYLDDRVDAKALLVDQLTAEVDFLAAVRNLHADGARVFLECGRVGLAKLVQRTVPDVQASAMQATPASAAVSVGVGVHRPAGVPAERARPGGLRPTGLRANRHVRAAGDSYGQPANGHRRTGSRVMGRLRATASRATVNRRRRSRTDSLRPTSSRLLTGSQPAYGQPAAVRTAVGVRQQSAEPTYLQPAQPTYLQPASAKPTYLQPAVIQPAAAQPGYAQPAGIPAGTAPTGEQESGRPAAAAEPGAGSVAEVLSELRGLYASSLGYPEEAISGDADLEADLGIDSLKRAEMLGKVRAHFGLTDSTDDGRFLAQSTLGELAELVAAAR